MENPLVNTNRMYATLRFTDSSIDIDNITIYLGIQPTRLIRKGEPYRDGGNILAQTSEWHHTSLHKINSQNFDDHIDYIMNIIINNSSVISGQLKPYCKIQISIYCLLRENQVMFIDSKIISILNSLDISLWFDIYPFEE